MLKSVTDYLDATASRLPDKLAFSDGKFGYTFSGLRDTARRIGSQLARRGVFKKPILVALERSPHVVAAFMGAAYSGNFYVPLDMTMPPDRIRKILQKLSPELIITDPSYAQLLTAAGAEESSVLFFDDLSGEEPDKAVLATVAKRQIDTDLLYVLFTSGSTGEPKGVEISHRSVIDYTEMLTETFAFNEQTVFGQTVPFTFDSSILYIYNVLRNGCLSYILPKSCMMFPAKMIEFLNEYEVNTIYWVPTSYSLIAKSGVLEKYAPKHLKNCLFVGEIMPNSVLNVWRQALPKAQFVNLFGPTEITGTFLYYIVDRQFGDDEPLPIGKPYSNVDVMILNEQDELCASGEIGELCVRSGKISSGYYNNPERTKQVFVQNPLNTAYPEIIYRTGDLGYLNERGEIMFSGRKDFMIKHSGYRIELGEIETAACSLDGVELCACVYDNVAKHIVLFYSGTAEINEVRNGLKYKLQAYMIPGLFKKLEEMPRNPNGKIDRAKLKSMI